MQPAIDDINLISAFQKGESSAYNTIFRHFARPLRFFVGRMVKDDNVAEDIAIDAFATTFRKNADFQTLDKLRSFLFTAAGNATIDYLRKKKRQEKLLANLQNVQDEETEDIELAYIRTEAIRAIHAAIETLPSQSQRVIRMAFIEGKKLQEIAAELGISYNTVQNHRARGLELVRMELIKNKLISSLSVILALSLMDAQ